MIAIELFFGLVIVGLIGVLVMQHVMGKEDHGHKGDAVKTEEEIRSHKKQS